jgi:LmbE family N-acetylglucosaminyl deacetylase
MALAAAVAGCRSALRRAPAARPAEASTPVPAALSLALPPRARLLVFAPHPDDEVLGAGGLVARQAAAGQPVRIVFFTNGDAYREAIAGTDAHHPPHRNDYLALGRRRQHEALTAARRLGLRPTAVRFLGYPDDGLAALWQAHWTRPYTSPYTRERSARYPDVLLPGAEYDGAELRWLVERVITRFRPTVIVFPHPADTHLDHHHAGYFVLDAVSALQARRRLPRTTMLLAYVVHYPSWPLRRGPAKDRCQPDARIEETVWAEVELTARELETKREALDAHRTQLAVMGGFLRAFLCRNELFGVLDHALLGRIAAAH